MIKTLTNLFKQDKEQFLVPKGVQDCMPAYGISRDGILRLTRYKKNGLHKYSNTFKLITRWLPERIRKRCFWNIRNF